MVRQPASAASRCGLTLIETLVVLAVIAVLGALLVPAVQQVRNAAAAAECRNNLRQIALATLNFHDAYKAFPPARIIERPLANDPPQLKWGGEHPTWFVRILPYVEQQAMFSQWDVTAPFKNHTETARTAVVPIFFCPARRSASQTLALGTSPPVTLPCGCVFPGQTVCSGASGDYAGNHGDLSPGSTGSLSDFYWGGYGTGVVISSRGGWRDGKPSGWIDRVGIKDVTDGLSNTFLCGEMHIPLGKIATPEWNPCQYDGTWFYSHARVGGIGVPLAQSPTDDVLGMGLFAFGSWHSNVCQFALADGSVSVVRNNISTTTLERLCHRSDGHPVNVLD